MKGGGFRCVGGGGVDSGGGIWVQEEGGGVCGFRWGSMWVQVGVCVFRWGGAVQVGRGGCSGWGAQWGRGAKEQTLGGLKGS